MVLTPASEGVLGEGLQSGRKAYRTRRWDTPQHVLVDDPKSGDPADVIWPGGYMSFRPAVVVLIVVVLGKDYSNPRVTDFHTLSKPFEDMYDRSKVPRMPWSAFC